MNNDYLLIPDVKDVNKIGLNHLLTEMKFAREKTIDFVSDLTLEELDCKIADGFNTIGALLKHIAAMETYYRLVVFENRNMNEDERSFWRGAFVGELSFDIVKNNEIAYYLNLLNEIRAKSIELLNVQNDEWLYKLTNMNFGWPVNNYYCWFHVMQDEISHLGQIKIITKQIRSL